MGSNLHLYLAIAKEAMDESDRIGEAQTRPKPNGELGSIITYDPEHKSFKHSLIALAFAGIYLDALLYITGMNRLGKEAYDRIDRKCYQDKLVALGIKDSKVLSTCARFRICRNELVHERAFQDSELWGAQIEARKAIDLIDQITELLK
ncbi:MAG: hypothetical protein GY845_13335 [Planctomycetes bacterium]|nr:hypothetical protein [Planctomycetota bacterium]